MLIKYTSRVFITNKCPSLAFILKRFPRLLWNLFSHKPEPAGSEQTVYTGRSLSAIKTDTLIGSGGVRGEAEGKLS